MFATLYTTGEGSVRSCATTTATATRTRRAIPWSSSTSAGSTRWSASTRRAGCSTSAAARASSSRSRGAAAGSRSASTTAPRPRRHAREHFGLDVWGGDFGDFAAQGHALRRDHDVGHHRALARPGRAARRRAPLSRAGRRRGALDAEPAQHPRRGGRPALPRERAGASRGRSRSSTSSSTSSTSRPATLTQALGRARGSPSCELHRELTDLRRLTLSPATRLGLQALFGVARLTGLENRIFVVARAANGAGMG